GLDVALVSSRGGLHAEPSATVDEHRAAAHRRREDARNESGRMGFADADRARLGVDTLVRDVDVVVAAGQLDSGIRAERNIVLAFGVCRQRLEPDGGVVRPGLIVPERARAAGGVVAAGRVVLERAIAMGAVEATGGVAEERRASACHVPASG